MNFETIKKNYDHKLWNEALIMVAVKKGLITEEQYEEITGKEYPG